MRRVVLGLFFCLVASLASAADKKLESLAEPAPGLSEEVAAAIQPTGFRISDDAGVVCDFWLAKEAPLKPKFKPTLRVKYPFQIGQLVGVIRYPDGAKPSDFRGQPLKPGVYTLRYGLQPDDGNHLGTSDIRDFLVGCPPDKDVKAERVADLKKLFKLSGGASGTTHPAIYLLDIPPEKALEQPTVTTNEEKKITTVEASIKGKDAGSDVAVPLKVVVQGKSEG